MRTQRPSAFGSRPITSLDIEEFPVGLPVKLGDRMAVLATKIDFVFSAGDSGSQLFDPPLADGEIGRTPFDQGTGITLLEAVYDDWRFVRGRPWPLRNGRARSFRSRLRSFGSQNRIDLPAVQPGR